MKFVQGIHKQAPLALINKEALENCDEVWAAVAYVTDSKTIIRPCYEKKIPLRLWARYDYTIPVRVEILEWFIGKSPLSICKLIPDIFHPKVIWWKPYGVYIGSANLTDSAWFQNFEAGVFLTEYEIEEQGIKGDLESFFNTIDDNAHLLTQEIVDELKEHQKNIFFEHESQAKKDFKKKRRLQEITSISAETERRPAQDRRQKEFIAEWEQTLQYIRDISEILIKDENRPVWVSKDAPRGVQADQFLHAYYYNKVKEGNRALHREFNEINRKNPDKALRDAIAWWACLGNAPSNEDRMINISAPLIADRLSQNTLMKLNEAQFIEVFSKVHAFRNYADRASFKSLGLDQKLPNMTSEERGEYLAKMVFNQENENGETILSVLNFLLYGGPFSDLPVRLFDVCNNPKKALNHVSLGTFGEVVGWALPDKFPPRNGRTSKALYALGYDVKIYSE